MKRPVSAKLSKEATPARAEARPPEQTLADAAYDPQTHVLNLQRAAGNEAVGGLLGATHEGAALPPRVAEVLASDGGEPLEPSTRELMESHFGHDFGAVRVHAGARASESAKGLDAHAYAVDTHVVFDSSQYAPHTPEGQDLLAHELSHVVEQQAAGPSVQLASKRDPQKTQTITLPRATEESLGGGSWSPDLDEAKTIGSAGEKFDVEDLKARLAAEGYDEVYAKEEFGRKPRSKWLALAFPDGRKRPDLVAVNNKTGEILVVDVTASPSSMSEAKFGDPKALPEELWAAERGGFKGNSHRSADLGDEMKTPATKDVAVTHYENENKLHIEKTIEDARQLARGLTGEPEIKKESFRKDAKRQKQSVAQFMADGREQTREKQHYRVKAMDVHWRTGTQTKKILVKPGGKRRPSGTPGATTPPTARPASGAAAAPTTAAAPTGTRPPATTPASADAAGAKASAGTTPPAATLTPETAGVAKGEAAHAQPPAKAPAATETPAPAPAPAAAPAPARAPEPQPSKASTATTTVSPAAAGPETPARTRESAPPTPAPAALKAPPASPAAGAPVASPAGAPSLSAPARTPTIPGPPVEPGLAPATSPGLKPQRVTAHTGAPDMQPVSVGGPSARGDAMAGGAELGLRLLNEILNHFAGQAQEQRLADALAAIEPRVRSFQERNPHMGVTLIVYYSQWEAPPDSPIRPGPRFERIELGVGQTREEAFENWRDTPALRAALGHRVSESFEQLWVPPPKPLPPGPKEAKPLPEPPFPRLSLATFAGGAAALQNVGWDVSFGFDDEGETALAVPEGFVPLFYVLDVPKQLKLVAPATRRHVYERSVPVAERGVGGGSAPALDLDPYIPGGTASAVCVFPADHATAELFGSAPTTYGQGNFIGYRNFGLVRWVRPENIRLVR